MFATERIAQIVENCQTLVREESLSGQESGVVRAIEAMMRAYGFDEINIDRYGNIVGGLVGSRPGKTVVFVQGAGSDKGTSFLPREVKALGQSGDSAQVEGVKAGEKVAVKGVSGLKAMWTGVGRE